MTELRKPLYPREQAAMPMTICVTGATGDAWSAFRRTDGQRGTFSILRRLHNIVPLLTSRLASRIAQHNRRSRPLSEVADSGCDGM